MCRAAWQDKMHFRFRCRTSSHDAAGKLGRDRDIVAGCPPGFVWRTAKQDLGTVEIAWALILKLWPQAVGADIHPLAC